MRRLADRGMRGLARLLVHVFFRRIELQNGDRLPATGPVVLVANHLNGLVDGLLLIATLGRYPRFLGKSTLFKILPLWPFLKFAGVIPVYRVIDGAPGDHNVSAFATCHKILAGGGTVALFPEGISHDESSLQPLRTGAARIALEAGADGGIAGVVTVAVGLTYDAKARFRSRALVRVAEPVSISRWTAAHRSEGRDAVRQFTDDVAQQLMTVSPTYASWEQAERLSRVADVVARPPEVGLPADVTMADRVDVTERLAVAERGHARRTEVRRLLATFEAYERDLELLGLSDAQVAAKYGQGKLRGAVLWSVLKVVVALPLAAIGVVVHVVPYQIIKQLAKRPANEGMKATVKLLGCFALFAVVYVVLGIVVGRAVAPWAGLLVAVAAPLCGYVTVRVAERVKRIGGLVEGYRAVKDRKVVLATVFAHRTAVVDAARAVLVLP
jgi:glycerol-3-phosphate O-acyltransferase / dihydroxyacetone phosphate acyltransferase